MAKQLSVRIGDELEEKLADEKEKHEPFEPSDSEIVREALRQYFREVTENSDRTAAQTAD